MTPPPERIRWAVERLGVRPGTRVLELGMGRGVAAELLLATAPVTYVGVDRSTSAAQAARQRLEHHVRSGAAAVIRGDADRVLDTPLPPFDVAFAVNVNLFWTSPAHRELDVLRRLLEPTRGTVQLFYDVPGEAQARRIRELTEGHLRGAGFSTTVEVHPDHDPEPHRLFRVTGRVGPAADPPSGPRPGSRTADGQSRGDRE